MSHSDAPASKSPWLNPQIALDDFPEDLLDAIVRHLAELCDADAATIHLLEAVDSRVTRGQVASGECLAITTACLERVIESRQPVWLPEVETTLDTSSSARPGSRAMTAYAGVPVILPNGALIAVISVCARTPFALTPQAWRALNLAAQHVGSAFELAALRRQRELFPAFTDSLPGLFYILDENDRLLRWNGRLRELAGLDETSLPGIDSLELFAPEDRAKVAAQRARTLAHGQAEYEAGVLTADGRTLPYYFTGHRIEIEGRPCIIGMGLDLSAQRAAEEERDRLFDLSPDPLCMLSFDGHFKDLNPAWEEALGIAKKQLLGTSLHELVHPDDQVAMREALDASRSGSSYVEWRLRRAEGDWHWFAWHSRGDPERGLRYVVARDITTPRAVAAALSASEARYRSLVESARDAIAVIWPDGRIESIDGAFSETFGWEGQEWVGRNLVDLVFEPDLPRALHALSELDNEERMPVFEIRVRAKDGVPVPVEIQGTQIRLPDGTTGALVIARDVRERKAMDDRLQRIARLDAIGQLAAGVAHDFNNLLQIIHGEVDLLLTHPLLTPQVRDALQNVAEASTRAERITRKLLLLSREHEWQAEVVDLNEIVSRFLPMLRRLLDRQQQVDWQPAAALPAIRGDLGMLEQVLMNLLINARDAMPEGGTVTLATRVAQINVERADRDPDARAGPYVELSVSDSGTGIAPEHLPHIFEPLFTTKPVGEGTGLGLATIYGIVRRHEGWVDVESEVSRGSRFLLYFPIPASGA